VGNLSNPLGSWMVEKLTSKGALREKEGVETILKSRNQVKSIPGRKEK
jgi:hypothetical protein